MDRSRLPSLLLLPYPPSPLTRPAFAAAYRIPLLSALQQARSETHATTLIVAVAVSALGPSRGWSELQSLLARFYALTAALSTHLSLPLDVSSRPGTVDVRVVLVDHGPGRTFWPDRRPIEPNGTVILDLPGFAAACHPWNRIYSVGTEAGHDVLKTFLYFAEPRQKLLQQQMVVVDGGLTFHGDPASTPPGSGPLRTFGTVCLGGTFDHLHPGHKLLLSAATLLLRVPVAVGAPASTLIIGISADELLRKKKYVEVLQGWEERAKNVLRFLTTLLEADLSGWKAGLECVIDEQPGEFRATFRGGAVRVECVSISDAFGPTVTRADVDILVLTGETRAGGPPINEKRREKGWKALEIFECDVLDSRDAVDEDREAEASENFAAKISSTEIRRLESEKAARE